MDHCRLSLARQCRHTLADLANLTEHAPNRPACLARHLAGFSRETIATLYVFATQVEPGSAQPDVLSALASAFLDNGSPYDRSAL